MTTAQLDQLPPGATIYIPGNDTVSVYLIYPRCGDNAYYTLLAAPDEQTGEVSSKRPFYAHPMDLLPATTDKKQAWTTVRIQLLEQLSVVEAIVQAL